MIKNDITYEYRVFTNRLIDIDSMEVGTCTSKSLKELKEKDKVNGRFFHTSDTDEWFLYWNNELQKLNLKGDSDVNSALDEVRKLISEANIAVSDAKKTAKEAKDAATEAKIAADNASAAVESIDNKADKSELNVISDKVDTKADQTFVNELFEKVEGIVVPTKVSQLENDKNYLTEHQNISHLATKDELPKKVSELENDKGYITIGDIPEVTVPTKTSELTNDSGFITLADVPNVDMGEYVTETELENKGYLTVSDADSRYIRIDSGSGGVDLSDFAKTEYVDSEIEKIELKIPIKVSQLDNDLNFLTEHQDITNKQDVIEDLDTIREGASAGLTALQSVPDEYVTETELENKGYLTEQNLNGYATEEFVNGEIEKIQIPSMDNYFTKDEINEMIGNINSLISESTNITNTILS